MIQQLRRSTSGLLVACGLPVLVTLWILGMPFYFRDAALLLGAGLPPAGSYRLGTVANTLLAASTALYLAGLWFSGDIIRRFGAWFAGLGAGCIILDILVRSSAVGIHGRALVSAESMNYEFAALLVAVGVAALLLVERSLRLLAAGAFVMPLVMGGVVVEIWLMNHGASGAGFAAFSGLRAYWGEAYLVAQVIGYGAFLAAAGIGLLYLARYAAEEVGAGEQFPLRALPGLWRLYSMMISAIEAGFPVFVVAALMLFAWMVDSGDWGWVSLSRSAWTIGVAAIYGFLAYLLVFRVPTGPRLAALSVLGFGASLLGFVLMHSTVSAASASLAVVLFRSALCA